MRRSEREVTDPAKIGEIIAACRICRLGLSDFGEVYIVPMNFGYEERDGKRYLYFHSAREGRKIELLRRCASVGFEMDTGYRLIEGDVACGYSAEYQSIIGTGSVVFFDSLDDKRHALERLMLHIAGREDLDFSNEALNRTAIFRLEVETLSCKVHIKDA